MLHPFVGTTRFKGDQRSQRGENQLRRKGLDNLAHQLADDGGQLLGGFFKVVGVLVAFTLPPSPPPNDQPAPGPGDDTYIPPAGEPFKASDVGSRVDVRHFLAIAHIEILTYSACSCTCVLM